VILFQTINYFSLLDLGLTSSIIRFVSKYLSQRDFGRVSRVIATSGVLYLIVGSLAAIGLFIFVEFFFHIFKIADPNLLAEGKTALQILAVYLAFNFYFLPYGGSLVAFQRYDMHNLISIGEEIVRVGLMIWLLSAGYGLVALALVIVGTTIARNLIAFWWLRRAFPEIKFGWREADRETGRMLFGYSWISFAIVICWLVIFNTDSFLLGVLSGTAAAGVYHPGAQLFLHLRNLINGAATPLAPAVSHIESTSDLDRVRRLYFRGSAYIAFASFTISTLVILFAQPFVDLWLPEAFAESASVMIVLACGSALFLPQIVGNSVLFGIEQHRYLLYSLICEAAAKIVLAIVLIPRSGLLGMALATIIPQIAMYSTLYPALLASVLGTTHWKILWNIFRPGGMALAAAAPVGILLTWLWPVDGWLSLIAEVAIVVLIAAVVAYRFLLAPDDRNKLIDGLPFIHQ